jgi:hypothetical protein
MRVPRASALAAAGAAASKPELSEAADIHPIQRRLDAGPLDFNHDPPSSWS